MVRTYIAVAFKGRENKVEIEDLCSLVKASGFEDFCFVRDIENYRQIFDDPKKLMAEAKKEIEKSDYFLLDVTVNPSDTMTGRLIELGIAYNLGKKIIVISKKGAVIKNTVAGTADIIIEYQSIKDIVPKLKALLV